MAPSGRRLTGVTLVVLTSPAWAQGPALEGTVTTLNCPGATLTAAADINDSGKIVGRCVVGGQTRGFLYEPGHHGNPATYTFIEVPGAARTEAWGISENGEISGYWVPPGETRLRGFVRSTAGEYVILDRPGDFFVMPFDVNNAGFIAGCMHNAGTMHAWVSRDAPRLRSNPAYEMFTGLNESGMLVGWGASMSQGAIVSFSQNGIGRAEIRYPSGADTYAYGVNQYAEVVGWFGPGSGGSGFRLSGGEYRPIELSGAAWTRAMGLNSAGHIVGLYRIGGATRGFVLVPSN